MHRPERLRILDGLLVLALALAAVVALPRAAAGVGSGLEQLVVSVQTAIPLLQGRSAIELPPGGSVSIGAAPVVDALPAYTREPQLQLTGRLPAYAVQPGRTLQIVLNGAIVDTKKLEDNGAFNTTLALKEGANAISVTVIGNREVVAASAYTVVLDRTPPTLTITQPQPGATIDSQNVVVAGASEAGSTITVNGRTVLTASDGGFTDSFTATAGPLTIVVVSRDRAGNETTQKLTAIGLQLPSAAGATVSVTLDRPTVRPGQTVIATIRVTDLRGPRAGVTVTVSVGIVTIGTAITDATGTARLGFAAPANEGEASVVVLGAGASGRAPLTISAR